MRVQKCRMNSLANLEYFESRRPPIWPTVIAYLYFVSCFIIFIPHQIPWIHLVSNQSLKKSLLPSRWAAQHEQSCRGLLWIHGNVRASAKQQGFCFCFLLFKFFFFCKFWEGAGAGSTVSTLPSALLCVCEVFCPGNWVSSWWEEVLSRCQGKENCFFPFGGTLCCTHLPGIVWLIYHWFGVYFFIGLLREIFLYAIGLWDIIPVVNLR